METKPKPKIQNQNLLVEVSDQEVRIEFKPNTKCRATISLKSLTGTTPVAFKVQTSSPQKFLVNPPAGIIPPLSAATFQVILKPQSDPPSPYPRSPSDRFLVKTAPFSGPLSGSSSSVVSWFASRPSNRPTQDHRLKTAFVGRFLLRHAVVSGHHEAARNLVKRQRSLLSELSSEDSDELLRLASELPSPERMVNLLLESGLRIGGEESALREAADKGSLGCVRAILKEGEVETDSRGRDGRTALHRAAARGDRPMVELLLDSGADPSLLDDRGRSAIDVAREKGHIKVAEILGRGGAVIMAARRGDLKHLELLIKTGAVINFRDQHGLTALHAAAMKGHKEVVSVLVEHGLDVESRDKEGHSPLHLAIVGGSLEAVAALVSKGADVNAKSRGRASPLHMANAMGHHHIAEFLISKGASSSTLSS